MRGQIAWVVMVFSILIGLVAFIRITDPEGYDIAKQGAHEWYNVLINKQNENEFSPYPWYFMHESTAKEAEKQRMDRAYNRSGRYLASVLLCACILSFGISWFILKEER